MPAVAVADIKNRIKKPTYDMIVGRDDTVCERALVAAEIWAKSRFARGGITSPDLATAGAKEAIILRTISGLCAYNNQPDLATENLAMAREILDGMIGMAGSAGGNNGPVMVAVEGTVPTWLANY